MANISKYSLPKKPVKVPDPNRPNLMKHDKTIREQAMTIDEMQTVIKHQTERIDYLKAKLGRLENLVDRLVGSVNNINRLTRR